MSWAFHYVSENKEALIEKVRAHAAGPHALPTTVADAIVEQIQKFDVKARAEVYGVPVVVSVESNGHFDGDGVGNAAFSVKLVLVVK